MNNLFVSLPIMVIICAIFASESLSQDWTYFNKTNSGISDNRVKDIVIDNNGVMWLATHTGGLVKYYQDTWEIFDTTNSSIPSNNVVRIATFDEQIWLSCAISTFPSLVKFENEAWTVWDKIFNGTAKSNIADLEVDEEGAVWIPTVKGSGWIIRFKDGSFTTYNNTNSCLPRFSTDQYLPLSIACEKGLVKWIGVLCNACNPRIGGGIIRMDSEGCQFYNSTNSNFPANSQSVLEVHRDIKDPDAYWILTNTAILKFEEDSFQALKNNPMGNCCTMAIDSLGRIWAAGFDGLSYYANDRWTVMRGKPDYGIESLWVDANNRMWVGTASKGLAYMDLGPFTQTTDLKNPTESYKVFPSVVENNLIVQCSDGEQCNNENQIIIFDTNGRLVINQKLRQAHISTSIDLPKGINGTLIYHIVKASGEKIQVGKLIKITN